MNLSRMLEIMKYGIKKVEKQVNDDKNTKDQTSTINTDMTLINEETNKSQQMNYDSLILQYISKIDDDENDEILEEQEEQKYPRKQGKKNKIHKQKKGT